MEVDMKRYITGWIAKDSSIENLLWLEGSESLKEITLLYPIWAHKGKKSSWDITDWPPKKVKITVEEAK